MARRRKQSDIQSGDSTVPGVDLSVLKAEYERLLGELERVETVLRALGIKIANRRSSQASSADSGKRRRRRNTRNDQIVSVLKAAGGALHADEIRDELRRRDIAVGWQDPVAAVRALVASGGRRGADSVIALGRGRFVLQRHQASAPPPAGQSGGGQANDM